MPVRTAICAFPASPDESEGNTRFVQGSWVGGYISGTAVVDGDVLSFIVPKQEYLLSSIGFIGVLANRDNTSEHDKNCAHGGDSNNGTEYTGKQCNQYLCPLAFVRGHGRFIMCESRRSEGHGGLDWFTSPPHHVEHESHDSSSETQYKHQSSCDFHCCYLGLQPSSALHSPPSSMEQSD